MRKFKNFCPPCFLLAFGLGGHPILKTERMQQAQNLDYYITLAFMIAFFGGMVTMWVAIQLDKLFAILVFAADKHFDKDKNKSQNNK